MKLSVAMTTYCGSAYVKQQLESLLEQTRPADEVVIIDDCSKDNTAEIVRAFLQAHSLSNWHFSVNEQNLGYKQNFKEAITRTGGDIIFLCDQDDIWHPDKLERMEGMFERYPSCMAMNTGFRYIDGAGAYLQVDGQPGMSNHNLIKRPIALKAMEPIGFCELVSYNISPGCTMAFRTAVKKLYLDRTRCGVVHDWELNLAAAITDGCWFWNEELIDYRIHGDNAVGIPGVGAGAQVDRGGYRHRLAVARQMKDYTLCFVPYTDLLDPSKQAQLAAQTAFVKARYEALSSKKLGKVLALYRYKKNYCSSVTWKGRLADIACVLKPES